MADITTTKTGGATITVVEDDAGSNVTVTSKETNTLVTEGPSPAGAEVDVLKPQGPPGPDNLFVQPDAPVTEHDSYLWIQTGLGPSGEDITFWIEDGQ